MVKKLFKHEFLAILRLMLPVWCAVFGVGFLTRMLMFFENDSIVFKLTATSAWVMLAIAFVLAFVLLTAFAIVRYYKNMFSYEGYLTFTLPVTNTQHILVKTVTVVLFEIITLFAVVISFCVATSGNLLIEILKTIGYCISKAAEYISVANMFFIALEIIIALLLGAFYRYLIYYSCITIGQTAKKHRILWAVGVYFIYYAICQALATVFQIIMLCIIGSSDFLLNIGQLFVANPLAFCHGALGICIIATALFDCALFFIIRRIITKKLNLE